MSNLQIKTYDVVIIGAGSAGISARNEVAKVTDNYLVIDGGPLGTTCARIGCMPSKSFIEAAKIYHQSKKFERIGVEGFQNIHVNTVRFMKHVRSLRDHFVSGVYKDVEKWITSHFLKGTATFIDEHILEVDGDLVFAKKIIVATGSRPRFPAEWEHLRGRVLTNENIFELEKLPKKLAVIGTGAIGLEMAQALAYLDIEVLLFGKENSLGGLSDPAIIEYAGKYFAKEMQTYQESVVDLIEENNGFRIFTSQKNYFVDQVLVATGREPNLKKVGIENLGLALNEKGLPKVDPQTMRILDKDIYVAGDVSAFRPVLHEATDEGRIAGRNAVSKKDVAYRRRTPLLITYTNPQLATVGLSWEKLQKEKKSVVFGEVLFDNQGRSRTKLENAGILRVYADKKKGQLLGAEMFAPEAEHLAHHLATAIDMELSVFELLSHPFYHPVIEEGLRSALRDLAKKIPHRGTRFDLFRCHDAIAGR